MRNPYTTKIIQQSSPLYGLGVIGALFYFIQHAAGFWMGALGVLKAFFWPAFVVYEVLELLKIT